MFGEASVFTVKRKQYVNALVLLFVRDEKATVIMHEGLLWSVCVCGLI